MKKSKMVELMMEMIADAKYGRTDVEISAERLAINILERQLEEGILPPLAYISYKEKSGPLKGVTINKQLNAWEPEDA